MDAAPQSKNRRRVAWAIGGVVLLLIGIVVWANWDLFIIKYHFSKIYGTDASREMIRARSRAREALYKIPAKRVLPHLLRGLEVEQIEEMNKAIVCRQVLVAFGKDHSLVKESHSVFPAIIEAYKTTSNQEAKNSLRDVLLSIGRGRTDLMILMPSEVQNILIEEMKPLEEK